MSQKTVRLPYEKRKHVIKEHIVNETQEQIARRCGVVRETINRDIQRLKADGEWYEWLELFLLKLYANADVSEDAKLRSVTSLYGKTIPQISHIETDGNVSIVVEMWTPNGDKDEDQVPPT